MEAQQRGYPMKERSASAEVAEDFSTAYTSSSGSQSPAKCFKVANGGSFAMGRGIVVRTDYTTVMFGGLRSG